MLIEDARAIRRIGREGLYLRYDRIEGYERIRCLLGEAETRRDRTYLATDRCILIIARSAG